MFAETHEEVRNFALRLFRDSMEDRANATFGFSNDTITDHQGNFVFSNVLPGTYRVFQGENNNKTFKTFDLSLAQLKKHNPIQIVDQDVENVQLFLGIQVRTVFRGQVLDQQGKPVQNATLMLDKQRFSFEENSFHTDENGRFEITIRTFPSKETRSPFWRQHCWNLCQSRIRSNNREQE